MYVYCVKLLQDGVNFPKDFLVLNEKYWVKESFIRYIGIPYCKVVVSDYKFSREYFIQADCFSFSKKEDYILKGK